MITVTGVGVALPGAESAEALFAAAGPDGVVDPSAVLGRKGLRYKDRATQIGLSVAQRVLVDAGLLADGELTVDGTRVAVVVSSNLGNVETACRVTKTIAEETSRGLSPMDTPNASSNIISSEVAIRFGLHGPNLMMCNGATSGLDAVRWAATLLRSGRADRAVVVGIEPDNEIVRSLVGERVADGGAAIVLESAEAAAERGATVYAVLGAQTRGPDLAGCLEKVAATETDGPTGWFVPAGLQADSATLAGVARHDLSATWGHLSGALGVVQCAAAIGRFRDGDGGPVYLTSGSDGDDGSAVLVLRSPATEPVPA
ncbi:beta-ketoacyl synthase N-terminal-like domain-containing protein [Amycolatopsis sp. H20-H5]|uniref:beta-ketoacyl synthase N-terminal-like domain-containing protein n=1 Tax=Amycolatopsis sp. H20-H5 TaxID=3046309 RepID=UPI002DB92259|nr:beta-ketoacyl synthase N-terminal-like domain-containing protein [Amycolatopsis sp. H20-H5]MEC3979490.1 beta-ketoacyl synthase N-terminal-like domain-containing protein [Amycolatopsis sp. H20-H5]